MADNFEVGLPDAVDAKAKRKDMDTQQMQITIDSQSFVNLGQLMGSRTSCSTASAAAGSNRGSDERSSGAGGRDGTGAGGGASLSPANNLQSKRNSHNFAASFLSDGLHDDEEFDQIFHPAGSNSMSSAWSGHEICSDGESNAGEDGVDDDSVLPAVPSRSMTPASPTRSDLSDPVLSGVFLPNKQHPSPKADEPYSGDPSDTKEGFRSDATKRADSSSLAEASGTAAFIPPDPPSSLEQSSERQSKASSDICTKYLDAAAEDLPRSPKTFVGASPPAAAAEAKADTSCDISVAGPGAEQLPASVMRESWLHVARENSDDEPESTTAPLPADEAPKCAEQKPLPCAGYWTSDSVSLTAERASALLRSCGGSVAYGVNNAVVIGKPRLWQLARQARTHCEAGADAFARARKVAVQAIDSVPQAPVRSWLARIAVSLILGAILGSTATYYSISHSVKTSSWTHQDSTSPWWNSGAGLRGEASMGGEQQVFVERMNKALFAARAGEAAAQQVLLEEVRTILAATGESGGISAEQILRQFNAKRFAEASKAWSAAEGIAGADPLDPLFFAPPSTPVYKTTPSASQQYHSPRETGTQNSDCAGGVFASGFCSAEVGGGSAGSGSTRGYHFRTATSGDSASTGRQFQRRTCAGGGWVC